MLDPIRLLISEEVGDPNPDAGTEMESEDQDEHEENKSFSGDTTSHDTL